MGQQCRGGSQIKNPWETQHYPAIVCARGKLTAEHSPCASDRSFPTQDVQGNSQVTNSSPF